MKKTMFARILIVLMCLALVLCGCSKSGNDATDGGSNGSGKPKSPNKQMSNAFSDTLGAIFADGANTEVLEKALKTGKITITVGDMLENVLYISSEKMALADEMKLNVEGMEVDAELYINENDLVVALPGILDGAYGVSFDTLLKDLENSALWELMGTDYESIVGELESSMGDVTELMDQLQPLLEGMGETIDSVLKCVNSSVAEGTATVNGKEVKATIITYSFGNEELGEMVDVLFDYVDELTSTLASMGGEIGDVAGELDAAREEAKAVLEEAEIDFKLVTNINTATGYVMTVDGDLKIVYEGEEAAVNLDANFGEDATKSEQYTIDLTATAEGETVELMSVVLDRIVDGSVTDYDLSVSSEGYEVFTANLEYDSETSAYCLTVMDGDVLTVDGTYKFTDEYFEFSIGSVKMDGNTEKLDVKIVIEAISASEMPKAPSYTNVLTMSQKDWEKLAEELSELMG